MPVPDNRSTASEEHLIVVPRSARYHTLGPVTGARTVWLVCHGQGQLAARFIRHFEAIDDGTCLVVAPEAHSRYYLDPVAQQVGNAAPRIGASWMTKEFREQEIGDYVRYLELVMQEVQAQARRSPRIIALGFSQGAAAVCRWMASSAIRADQLVLWGGGIPPELDLKAWKALTGDVPLTYVIGDQDEFITPKVIQKELRRVEENGLRHRVVSFHGPHVMDSEVLKSLAGEWGMGS